jgi:hypothetical protein
MISSRQIALQGLGGDSRTVALQGLYELLIAIPNDPFKYKGNNNTRLPQYLIRPGGGKFRKR